MTASNQQWSDKMDNFHDPIRHLKYLRQSLSQDNESIGFFISAGCPLSVVMPEDKYPLIPDVANLTKFINEQLKGQVKFSVLLAELKKAEKNVENIEDILRASLKITLNKLSNYSGPQKSDSNLRW